MIRALSVARNMTWIDFTACRLLLLATASTFARPNCRTFARSTKNALAMTHDRIKRGLDFFPCFPERHLWSSATTPSTFARLVNQRRGADGAVDRAKVVAQGLRKVLWELFSKPIDTNWGRGVNLTDIKSSGFISKFLIF